ncbi:TIGR02186 family protein [Amaricoccus sp.]|uniref:TIGR02186 family protein n=1 Tax=Amaricoccus sp. TaxID=1872485 RepID=UPI002634F6B0|nr:TIGR02186 family protein [Amaricoccus sp.]HRO10568.1 TIGR02186 family protein [Amaricoccus sp.]
MIRLAAVLLALVLTAPLPAQESVVTGVSTENIGLNATFDGSDLFVFGAIRRDAPIPPEADPIDVVITIKGPPRNVRVRHKERRLGIWMNTESLPVRQVPSFYAIATTRPLEETLSETERLRYQIGMDEAVRRVGGHDTIEDTTVYTDALVRLKERSGSYQQRDGAVLVAEETLFQTSFHMPANLTEGNYIAQFFLVRDREVISSGTSVIRVAKTGIERWLYNLSRNRPLLYGLASVAAALAAGWLAAEAFRLARR